MYCKIEWVKRDESGGAKSVARPKPTLSRARAQPAPNQVGA